MSETDAQSPSLPAPDATVAPSPTPSDRRTGTGLAGLALLIALLAAGAGGWSAWQLHQQNQQQDRQQADWQQLQAQWQRSQETSEQRLTQAEQRLQARLGELPSVAQLDEQRQLLMSVQGDQQQLASSLNQLLGASREDWRLAEAEHLLRLAMLRLSALQDVASATALVQGADDILRAQDDPLAFAARGELIKALEALRALPQPDRNGLFLQLAALREQAERLTRLAPEFRPDDAPIASAETTQPAWQRWWHTLSKFVRIDVNADQNIRPLLAGQSLSQVRLALALALEQAQWGALNARAPVYSSALGQADDVLKNYFDVDNPAVQSLRQRIAALAEQAVEVETPELRPALLSLQAYVQQRQTPRNGEAEQEAAP